MTPEARRFVNKGERLVMKFRGASARGAPKSSASGTTRRRKRASAVGTDVESASAAGPSRKGSRRNAAPQEDVMDLYQDDDVFDFGSPKKPPARAQGRAAAAADVDDLVDAAVSAPVVEESGDREESDQDYASDDTARDGCNGCVAG